MGYEAPDFNGLVLNSKNVVVKRIIEGFTFLVKMIYVRLTWLGGNQKYFKQTTPVYR